MTTFRSPLIKVGVLVVMAFMLVELRLWAAQSEDGGQSGAFLEMLGTPRSLAMGKTGVSTTFDASSSFINPAGLAFSTRKNFMATYSTLLEDSNIGAFGFAQPSLTRGTVSVGVVSLRSGSFEKRNSQGFSQGQFDQSELGVLLSHGLHLGSRLSLGSTLKYVRQEIDTYSDTGYGLDLGLLWQVNSPVKIGFVAKNLLSPTLTLNSSKETFDREFRLGLGWNVNRPLLFAFDMVKLGDQSVKPHLGAEWKFNPLCSVRAGANNTELSAGLGLSLGDWGVDYSFGAPFSESNADLPSGYHRVGFRLAFGPDLKNESLKLVYQRRGLKALSEIEFRMNETATLSSSGIQQALNRIQDAINSHAFTRPFDLYRGQAYLSYFKNEFARSVQFFSEALVLDPENRVIQRHSNIAQTQMKNRRVQATIDEELRALKDVYSQGLYRESLSRAEGILQLDPEHIEAKAYKDDAERQIREPIDREFKIAQAKYNAGDYFEAIRYLQNVKKMDPDHDKADGLMSDSIVALESKARQLSILSAPKVPVVELSGDVEKSRKYYTQGLFLYSQGKLKEALSQWKNSLESDPQNILARNAYNRTLQELQEESQ